MSQREAAEVLGVSQRTVSNDVRPEQNCSIERDSLEEDDVSDEQNCSTEEEQQILDQLPDPGDAHRRAKVRKAFAGAVLQVSQGFMTLDPEITVEVLTREDRDDLRRFIGSVRGRLDTWESVMTEGLHVVRG